MVKLNFKIKDHKITAKIEFEKKTWSIFGAKLLNPDKVSL